MSHTTDAKALAFAFVEYFSSGEGAAKPGDGGASGKPVVDPGALDIVCQCLCAGYGVDYTKDEDRARFYEDEASVRAVQIRIADLAAEETRISSTCVRGEAEGGGTCCPGEV